MASQIVKMDVLVKENISLFCDSFWATWATQDQLGEQLCVKNYTGYGLKKLWYFFLRYCLRIYMELVKKATKISVKVACLWIWSQICDFLMVKQDCGTFHHDTWWEISVRWIDRTVMANVMGFPFGSTETSSCDNRQYCVPSNANSYMVIKWTICLMDHISMTSMLWLLATVLTASLGYITVTLVRV